MTAMTAYTVGYCHVCITHLIGLSVSNNVILFLYSASENIHHPLIETEKIMETTSVYQFCILLYDCHLHTNQV